MDTRETSRETETVIFDSICELPLRVELRRSSRNDNWLPILRHLISNYQGDINMKKSRASFLRVFALGVLLVSQALSAAPPSVDLWTAAMTGNIGALEEHQAAGTNLNAPDPNGSSALHAAARLDQAKAADWLLTNGAFVDFRGGDGGTPLITAAFMGHPKTVKVLLKHGADVNATSDGGPSSLQVLAADWELTRYIIEDLLQLRADRQKIERGREQIRSLLN
jgi:hypothetical protein